MPTAFAVILGVSLLTGGATNAPSGEVTEVIDGVKWTTVKNLPIVGDPKAQKGGEFREQIPNYVPTLRRLGPNSRMVAITNIYGLTHETLLSLHPETHQLVPGIASHWRMSEDKKTFWYKLDPRAKFSNGERITSKDVIASWKMLVNPDIKDPSTRRFYDDQYSGMHAEGDDVVRLEAKILSFRGLIDFAIFAQIYPASQCDIPADVYLSEYNWKMFAGSGPYIIEDYKRDLIEGVSITLTRRNDWWGAEIPDNQRLYNFDKIHFMVVRDPNIAFEKLKAGELDYIKILKSQRWVEECNFESVQKGWVQKRKVYTEKPHSYSGYMFNMREWPFNDKDVRRAFSHAFNRELLFEKFFFNEYEYLDSFYPGGADANPKNRKVRFSERRANRALDRAGYTKRNEAGIRVHEKTGQVLSIEFEFGTPSFERLHRVLVESLAKVGFELKLKLVDYNALLKRVGERKFKLHYAGWAAPTFPNPLSQWDSDLADKTDNNNITGYKNPRVDELVQKYRLEFSAAERHRMMREIDGLVHQEYPVALSWFAPFERILYWNRFGHPDSYLTRFTDDRSVRYSWWFDPAKDAKLKEAMKNDTKLPVGEMLVDPWQAKARLVGDDKMKNEKKLKAEQR